MNPLKDKTSCIVIGFKKQRYQVEVELLAEPLMSGDIQVKLKQQFIWQVLSSAGLPEYVAVTVEDQEGKIRGTSLKIVQIVNYWMSQAVESVLLYTKFTLCCGNLDRLLKSYKN